MLLLTPGPVQTDPRVKAAMAQDYAPWDEDFRACCRRVNAGVLTAAEGDPQRHAALMLPGSGHYAMEAALRAFVSEDSAILVPGTGTYADRVVRLARAMGRRIETLEMAEDAELDLDRLEQSLIADPGISHVVLIYSETGMGTCHDLVAVDQIVARHGRHLIVDAISALGALPLSLRTLTATDAVIATANKCLEGMPGIAYALVDLERLQPRPVGSWTLDLYDVHQNNLAWRGAARFTPSAPAIAALDVALGLFEAEGRVARLARYCENMRIVYEGMQRIGLRPYLDLARQGPIAVNIHAPQSPAWDLQAFVDTLKTHGFIIGNFYNTQAPAFRVGCIGDIHPAQMHTAVDAIDATLRELRIHL